MSALILPTARLSTLSAALIVARRDFVASVRSRGFILFLLGPLLLVGIALLAGGAGRDAPERPVIGLAMAPADNRAMLAARQSLVDDNVLDLPELVSASPGAGHDPRAALAHGGGMAAVLSGTRAAPVLTTTADRMDEWRGPVSLLAAKADGRDFHLPAVGANIVASSAAQRSNGQQTTGKIGQMLVFLLTMMLAGNVLSNLVEEKGNKIIEVLAAAIPLEALYFGKLLALLAMSFLGIAVWGLSAGLLVLGAGGGLPTIAAPAVGWPAYAVLTAIYFTMAYLLLGAIYLAIGGIAATIRDIQTLALPASLLQVGMFFFATYGAGHNDSTAALAARVFPLSSPFAMAALGATDAALWPHVLAIAWQSAFMIVFVMLGARLFRAKVMKSGPAAVRRPLWRQAR